MSIRVGIFGYGNLGRGVELALSSAKDMEIAAVFTRRPPESISLATAGVPVLSADKILLMKDGIDVLVICGGSAKDLPVQTPALAAHFNVVDSFDTHAKINEHFEKVDSAAKLGGKVALISAGWDPGMFSLARLYSGAILPDGKDNTFWGKGVSQGHSDAIRRIEGVLDAKQYTVPVASTLKAVRDGFTAELTPRQKHTRECYVVAKEGADRARIEKEIKTMPNYFADYNTTVHFITKEEMQKNHSGMPHGGVVIRSGRTGTNLEHSHTIEYSLKLNSNPEFTASVIVAYVRAVAKLSENGDVGCRTVFDIPPSYLSPLSSAELRATLL